MKNKDKKTCIMKFLVLHNIQIKTKNHNKNQSQNLIQLNPPTIPLPNPRKIKRKRKINKNIISDTNIIYLKKIMNIKINYEY